MNSEKKLYAKSTYIVTLFLNVVTARIEARVVSRNKVLYGFVNPMASYLNTYTGD
jgi:hypothetical protein